MEDVATEEIREETPAAVTLPDYSEAVQPPKPEISETKDVVKPQKKERKKKTDKGTYESVVTNNYFEGWDEELELEGNTGIKDKIRENIIQAEKRNQKAYKNAATDLGISVEKFKARLQAKVESMVEQAQFFRATQLDVLEKIMNIDGRWKSQFEVVTSDGILDQQYRAAEEMRMFGFNKTEGSEVPTNPSQYSYGDKKFLEKILKKDREKRPIYGYFSDDEQGGINSYNGKIPPQRM